MGLLRVNAAAAIADPDTNARPVGLIILDTAAGTGWPLVVSLVVLTGQLHDPLLIFFCLSVSG